MFSEKIGVKLFYKVDKFVNDSVGCVGILYNAIGPSFVYNSGKEIGLTYLTRYLFGIATYLGQCVSFVHDIDTRIIEKVGVLEFGITKMYNISKKIATTADLLIIEIVTNIMLLMVYYYIQITRQNPLVSIIIL